MAGLLNLARPNLLPKWRAALALQKAGTRNAIMAVIGDSTTAGFGAGTGGTLGTNARALGYPSQLAGLFSAGSWQAFFGDQASQNGGVSLAVFDNRVNLGTNWANISTTTFGGFAIANSTGTDTFSFTPTTNIDTAIIYTPRNSGLGTLTVNFDGGSNATINEAGTAGFIATTITTTLGPHSVEINRVSGSCYIAGIAAFNSAAKEVSIYNGGVGGAKIADFIVSTNPYNYLPAFKSLSPDLTIIDATINDWQAGTDITTFSNNTQTLITAAKISGDVILMSGVPELTSVTPSATQAQYIAVYDTLAAANGLLHLNMTANWVSYAVANGKGWMFDQVHPNATGYANQAALVGALVNL